MKMACISTPSSVDQGLITGAHAIETESRQLTFAQRVETAFTDGKRHGGVTGVIVSIFIEEEGVDMQAIFIFEEACRGLDIFQLRPCCQTART